MTDLVVDASVAIKWVIAERGTPEALSLRRSNRLYAPELLVAECANALWRKTRLAELTKDEAVFAARLLQRADIELVPMRPLLETATKLAMALDHPAYDCLLSRSGGEPVVRSGDRPRAVRGEIPAS